MPAYRLPVWPYVHGGPNSTGVIRSVPADFKVKEALVFTPSGSGEHVFLYLEKTGINTEYMARQLAKFAGVKQRDIGYAGLKDRNAVTTQWFSVWLPGKEDLDWRPLTDWHVNILRVIRHNKKLKRGALACNSFQITVRDWQGDPEQTQRQLSAIKADGFANYFGEQRFGHAGHNMDKAIALFQGKKTARADRSLCLSAARSWLFNHLLARRVGLGNWNKALAGDIFLFASSNACFHAEPEDPEVIRRVAAKEIHPSGVLWGVGKPDVSAEALALERTVIDEFSELAQGLLDFKVERGRRALRVNVSDLSWAFGEKQLHLGFSLPAGSYATSLLREVVDYRLALDEQPLILI